MPTNRGLLFLFYFGNFGNSNGYSNQLGTSWVMTAAKGIRHYGETHPYKI